VVVSAPTSTLADAERLLREVGSVAGDAGSRDRARQLIHRDLFLLAFLLCTFSIVY